VFRPTSPSVSAVRGRPGFRKLLDRCSFDLRLGLLNVFKKKTGIESREHLDIVVGCAFGEAVVQENLLEGLSREFNPLEVGNADLFSDQRSNLVRAAQIADDVDMRMPLEIECIKGFRCDPGDVSWVNHSEGPIRNGEHITHMSCSLDEIERQQKVE
jgi:hypothetical protein